MDSRVTIMCVLLVTSELTKVELVMAPMCVRSVLQVRFVQQDGQILKNYAKYERCVLSHFQALEASQKYSAARHIFNSPLDAWKCDETRFLVFDILL